jgi:predicted RNase H-related nuclease YkuK (DUF458 family)
MTCYDEAREAIRKSSPQSSVYVGCDSIRYKKNGLWYAKYSTVIVLHMDSNRGCKLFHETVDLPDYGNLKVRLMTEVQFAIAAVEEILPELGKRHLEIHLDLNPNPAHKSNVAVKEALGYVQGQLGITAHIKPASWAATHAADHVVRH